MRCCITPVVALAVAFGACGPETTSFRPAEHVDARRAGPPSAAYDVYIAGGLVGRVHVWSSGGYVSEGDEPMTHVGFAIKNATVQALTFDADMLELAVFDEVGKPLPAARLAAITPLGPPLISVPAGGTAMFATYFQLPVRPRAVERMQVRWTVRKGNDEAQQVTPFVRYDGGAIVEPAAPPDAGSPSS